MGFGFRVGSGVRIYPSSRGISVGHGPVRYYTRVGRGKRRSGGSSATSYQRQVRESQRTEEVSRVAALSQALSAQCQVHSEEFPQAERTELPGPEPVDEREILKRLEAEAVADVPRFRLGERRTAKTEARRRFDGEVEAEAQRRAVHAQAAQRAADEEWQRLQGNDPEIVLGTLEAAFADNEAPAAAVSCRSNRVDVVMRWPELDEVVPERKPAVTPSGRPTIHKRTKTERADLYLQALASHALVTVKEALAVCPGIEKVGIAVIRVHQDAAKGDQVADAVLFATLKRSQLEGVHWDKVVSTATLLELATGRIGIRGKGGSRALYALDLEDEDEEKAFIAKVAYGLGARVPDTGVPGLELPVLVEIKGTV